MLPLMEKNFIILRNYHTSLHILSLLNNTLLKPLDLHGFLSNTLIAVALKDTYLLRKTHQPYNLMNKTSLSLR